MKKKIIIISIFSILILITAIFFISAAVESYNYDMDPANGVDILEGFGAVLCIGIGGMAILYEADLFYVVYYFFVKPKTLAKSIMVVISHVSLLLLFAGGYIADFLRKYVSDIFSEEIIVLYAFFLIYLILKAVLLVIPVKSSSEAEED